MRVAVTGGAGFIGSHLVDALLALGHEVTALDDLSAGRLENLEQARSSPLFHFIRGDVRDRAFLRDVLSSADAVFHLAARVGVKRVVSEPAGTLVNNMEATASVLDACRLFGLRLISFSSSEVYGDGGSGLLAEGDAVRIGPPGVKRWVYAAGKLADEALALAYHAEEGLRVTVVRCFNVCGPRQSDRSGMVLPTFIRQALAGEPLTVHGDGLQRRCFSWVGDVVRGAVALLGEERSVGEVFNIGNDEETTILDLARRVVRLTGSSSPIVHVPYEEVFGEGFEDVRRRVPSLDKIRRLLGYEPEVSLDETVRLTVESMMHEAALSS